MNARLGKIRPIILASLSIIFMVSLLLSQRGSVAAQAESSAAPTSGAPLQSAPTPELHVPFSPRSLSGHAPVADSAPPTPFAPDARRQPPTPLRERRSPETSSQSNPPGTQDLEGSYVYWVNPSPVNAGQTVDMTFYLYVGSNYSYENMYEFDIQLPSSWYVNYTYMNYDWYGCYPQYYDSYGSGQYAYWYAYYWDGYTFCGAWAPYYDYAFTVNVTINDCNGSPWDIYWSVYGDYSSWSGVYSSVGCNGGGPDPIPTPLNTLFFEGFEDGMGNWSASGLWNLESQSEACGAIRSPLPSPTYAAYYGADGACHFEVGYSSGSLTMLSSVPLPANASGATLSFASYEETECGGVCYYDQRWVEISTDGYNWYGLGQLGTEYYWYTATYSLNGYLGQNIYLRFRFDTIDGAVNNYFGWMIDNVTITVSGYPCNTVGYYDMDYGEGNSNQVNSIAIAGKTARFLSNLTPGDLTGVNVLYVQNPNNGGYGNEYLSNLGNVATAVANGMVLIIHDRYVDGAETILPGGGSFNIIRDFFDAANVDIRDYTTSVTSGPGGGLDNSTLDGGTSSTHGYADAASLPRTARLILTRGNQNEVVTFSYQYGFGKVIYSSIPLDYYLGVGWYGFSDVYAPNVIAHACEISVLPVTVAYFESQPQGEETIFQWTTATEAGNVGFNLYAETAAGRQRLNASLIPSHAVSTTTPQSYVYRAKTAETRFWLEDVDFQGHTRLHGPFTMGQAHGAPLQPDPIAWEQIGAEHARATEAHQAERIAANRAGLSGALPDGGPGFGGINLLVEQTGLHRVRFEDLVAYGLNPEGVPARRVALLNRGEPTPIFLRGNWFGPGSSFEFYGVAQDNLYTAVNVYNLVLDQAKARRIGTDQGAIPSADPTPYYIHTQTIERENGYSFIAPGGDPWYDTLLMAYGSPFSQDFTFEVEHLAADGPAPVLNVDLWGLTEWPENPDHHIQVALNGVLLADDYFEALSVHLVTVTLPPGLLHEGANTLTLSVPFDLGIGWDMIYLDRFSLTYARQMVASEDNLAYQADGLVMQVSGLSSRQGAVYRVSEEGIQRLRNVEAIQAGNAWSYRFKGSPQRATYLVTTNAAYLTPGLTPAQPYTDITGGSADYLIISHPDFISGLAELAQFHTQRGLAVKIVAVDDIYAQFSAGNFDPQAIKAYLNHAITQMGVQYVLLVGGDTYDYRDYLGLGSISFIPSLYGRTEPYVDFAPLDPLYADVNGDLTPDAAIGRWPVRTAAELAALLGKTLAYAEKDYAATAVLAADANEGDIAFSGFSQAIADQLGPQWSVTPAYLDDLGLAAARTALLDGINAGAAVTSYMGHSGPTSWTFAGLFNAADAGNLTNSGRPTVVTQWGCWNTYYVDPYNNTLAHQFLLNGDRGAAAVLGATTITSTRSDQALGLRVLPHMTTSGVTLGQALQTAKTELANTQADYRDVILGWTLLGDPALVVEP